MRSAFIFALACVLLLAGCAGNRTTTLLASNDAIRPYAARSAWADYEMPARRPSATTWRATSFVPPPPPPPAPRVRLLSRSATPTPPVATPVRRAAVRYSAPAIPVVRSRSIDMSPTIGASSWLAPSCSGGT